MESPVFKTDGAVYSVEALWEMSSEAPLVDFDIGFFYRELCLPRWRDVDGGSVAPTEVIDYRDCYPDHWGRIQAADTNHPILVAADESTVIDGLYRLSYLHTQGATKVWARLIKRGQLAQAAIAV